MPLQKSFSEPNGPSRTRQHWNKAKSHSAVSHSTTTRNPVSKTFHPISEVSKSKLNAFKCQNTTKNSDHDASMTDLPTISVDAPSNDDTTARDESRAKRNRKQDSETTPLSASKDSLTTPVSRLAWQDLIGTNESKEVEEDTSPNERIGWDTRDDPQQRLKLSPVMPGKRGKKRARSSSPVSSPASHSKPHTPAVNIGKLSRALKSPHADPALELWDRFSLNGSKSITPLGAMNSALAQIMVSSSPRPSRIESGLRRSISCGENWPKRRRVERADIAEPTEIAVEESPSGHSKSSMLNALLKRGTEKMDRSKVVQVRQDALRSPSPKKNSSQPTPETHDSPTQRKPSKFTTPSLAKESAPTMRKSSPDTLVDELSDYGDVDFDEDTLMELDASLGQPREEDTEDDSTILPADTGQNLQQQQFNQGPLSYDDEFADMDDDIFTAAEDLITQIDSSHSSKDKPETPSQPTVAAQEKHTIIVDDLGGDMFGDDFGGDFDFDAAEIAATQSASSKQVSGSLPPVADKPKTIQRYLVTKVLQSQYVDETGRESAEKILFVQLDRSNIIKTVHLRGDWVDTSASPKSYVHIIGEFQSTGQCIIDNSQNILILHPDQLISATVVADSFTCMRRAVLQDRVKATSDKTPPLVYGTLLHEIFQEALMSNKWSPDFLNNVISNITEKHVEDLYMIKVSVNEACEHLRSKMPELRSWAAAFVTPFPRPDAVVQGRNGEKANMCVTKLLDVEEHVWSPMYGLKGNIDATVQVTMKDGPQRRTLTVPFEVKTGHNATSNHQAQTSLYNLLLSDRYDVEIAYGILYYMETSQTIRIPTIRNELRHMIMQRNQLACYIRERSVQLPPMKRSTNTCGKCYAKVSCFIYHKLADNGDHETSGMKAKFDEVVRHLTPAHQEFFLKWEDLLTKEEKESQKLRRELWTMVSTEREKVGRCFANVIIEEGSALEDANNPRINRFQYTFVKEHPSSTFSFLDSQLSVGEPIVVSDEQGHFALGIGYVTSVRKHKITVAVDRRLHNARIRRPGFDGTNNQVFASIMEVAPEGATPTQSQGKIKEAPLKYRLDKDEFSSGMATVRNNLVQAMADGVFGSREIRRLVVDLAPPTFKAATTQYTVADQESLNIDQRKAIEKVMSANDYALVLGMPGTGKTTTIAHIIRALVGQGKSVLLTSYTHSAVDNILLKLKDDQIPILRLGAPAKVHPDVQDFAVLAGQPMSSFEEIRSAWHETPIVATTCLGVNHPVFNERTFDYCIVDEASQITLPICIGPIRMARTFVLVGDHNQLPPLVQNEEARVGGLDISLFKLLSDTHPDSVVNLEHQYRMCEDVMLLSNTLIYEGRLKCGTEALRHQKLDIPYMENLRQKHYDANTIKHPGAPRSFCTAWTNDGCWLRRLLDPEARVRFVNTDLLPSAREEAKGNRIVNPTEAGIVVQLVDALLTTGVPAAEIGVMTHYRSQLSLLKHGLRAHGSSIELHTADRFQGRDKEVVILSLVRSNEQCGIGDLLKDWRRINVAFTRAKTKLVVVGSRATLKGAGDQEMLSRFVSLMEDRDWVYDLPTDALESHFFDEGGAATQIPIKAAAAAAAGSETRDAAALQNSPPRKMAKKGLASGRKGGLVQVSEGKENQYQGAPKRGRITDRALLRGNLITRDIFNEITDGRF